MPLYSSRVCIKRVKSIVFRRYNHLSINHERLSINRSVEWLFPEVREMGRVSHACYKPATGIVIVICSPIGTSYLSRRHGAGGKRQWCDMDRLRWWNNQRSGDLVNLVALAVEKASQQ